MKALFCTFGTTVRLRDTFFQFCNLFAVRVSLELRDLKSEGEFCGPVLVIRSGLGHRRCPRLAACTKVSL
jgi:hypothetical protein